jgi:16S rRNA (cytosine1402-N4)-methyltransferase
MSQVPFVHRPVMVDEVVAALTTTALTKIVDATVGGGGHAAALLDTNPHSTLLGLDRDPDALSAAAERLAPYGDRVTLQRARFDAIAEYADGPVHAVLFDLGVSSPQLDRPERGFSYRAPGPLDMRMDPSQGLTAADVVNTYDAGPLQALLRANGEARFSHRITDAIIKARPIDNTMQLAEIVRDAIPAPARRRGGHPAKRVFQAIRIEVNGELEVLESALQNALQTLGPGGRLAVLSYHSGEDRIVKAVMVGADSGGCTCPSALPCVCGQRDNSPFRLVFRGGRTPTKQELEANPRAESARLRVIERTRP